MVQLKPGRVLFAFVTLLVTAAPREAPAQQGPWVLPVPAVSAVWDPVNRKIYASVGGDGPGIMANSVTAIDPISGRVGPSVFVGSDPGALALSERSKYLYVAVTGGGSVRRVDLPGLTAGPLYPMPDRPVGDLLTLPGDADGFIARRGNRNRYDDKLGIYVNGQLRGSEAGCASSLALGIAPTRIFTYQNQVSSWDFDGYDVTDRGVAQFSHTQSLMTGNVGLNGSLNGLIVASNSSVIDPEASQVVGRLNFQGKTGSYLPDPRTGTVICIGEEKDGQLVSFCSARNYGFLGAFPLKLGPKGGVGLTLRWGDEGIAYACGGKLVVLRLRPAAPPLPSIDLAVQRSALPGVIPPSGQLKYQLTVTHQGSQPSSSVFLSDRIPPAAEVVSMTASQGNATFAGGVIRAELGAMTPGARATVDVSLRFREVRDVRFAAVVRGFEPDPKPENNIARSGSEGPVSSLADLTGSWAALRQVSVGAGVNLRAGVLGRFTVRNEGKGASRPVVLRFYLSDGPRFLVERSPLLQEVRVPALRGGQTFAAPLEALLPQGDDVTGLFIFAVLDADRTLEEGNRENNAVGSRVP